jgi:fatty acid desaturase
MLPATEKRLDPNSRPTAESDHRLAQRLVARLHAPNPAIYWSDFLATSAIAWAAFASAVALPPFSAGMLLATAVAAFAFYRALCFLHEITHITSGALRGFETIWNWMAGVPLLMPSFVYCGVHQYHHNMPTYGTSQDPEYLPFSSSHRMTVGFVAHSVLIPAFLILRFLILSPAGLVWPVFHRTLAERASALTMNPAFRRKATAELLGKMSRWELVILLVWCLAGILIWKGFLPMRTLWVWYLCTATAALINTLRTLAAHRYEDFGPARGRNAQLLDSIDTPGSWWTEFWAPVGLRYHALHHYFPGLPYHNLPEAHRVLNRGLPATAAYRTVASTGILGSLASLYRRGKASFHAQP